MKTILFPVAVLSLVLSACSGLPSLTKQNEADTAKARARLQELLQDQQNKKQSNFSEQTGPTISIKPLDKAQQSSLEKKWLTDIQHITLDPAKDASIPAPAIIRMLRSKGINIVTSLPLDLYTYNGFGVTDVNAETALMVFLGAMGLDYELDNVRRLVTVEPMKSKTWTLNIGNRRTSFNAGDDTSASSSTSSPSAPPNPAGAGSMGALPGMPSSAYSGASSAGSSTSSSSGGSSAGGNANGITSTDDVWSKLSSELAQRLTILVPKTTVTSASAPIVPALTQPNQQLPTTTSVSSSNFYNVQTVGRFSINPETGAITVQAPKYLLNPLNEYMTRIQEMYNTVITFEGELLTVTTSLNVSEGIDWTAFNNASNGNYTTIAQNNILGGAVLTPATGTSSLVDALTIANSSIPGANALFGIASITKRFAAFNAYLSSIGQLRIKDTPLITTTSGTPVKFKNTTTRHYQQYQQVAAAGGVGSAAVATSTYDVPYETGMTLRLNPRYDVHSGLVRTQFSLERTMIHGFADKVNPISTGNSVQIINTKIPILSNTVNNGELLLKNGDFVVVGGLTEDSDDNSTSGVTGLIDTPFKALAGKDSRNNTTTTYYFALRVIVAKKD